MSLDTPTINSKLDILYPSNQNIGYVLLLSNVLISGLSAVCDHTSDTFSTNPTTFETGSKVRIIVSNGSYPTVSAGSAIDALTTYYLIKLSATSYKVARTLEDAQANTAIDFTDDGTGTLTINEQELDKTDPLPVLVKKELTHVDYTRKILNLPDASGGFKDFNYVVTVSDSSLNFLYKHKLVILGATNVIGNTTGTKDHFLTEASLKTYLPGQTALLGIRFSLSSI